MIVRIVLCLVLFFNGVYIANGNSLNNTEDSVSYKKEGFYPIPLLYYTPDTRFAAGAMAVYFFHTGDKNAPKEKHTRLSYIKLLADYTQNKQLDIWSSWNIFTKEEKFLFKGEFRYRNFPDRYYGIGNVTTEAQMERYSYDYFSFKLLGLRKINKGMFIGIDYHFGTEYNFNYFDDKELAKETVIGSKGGIGSAPGIVYVFDTRDNVVNAHKGKLIEGASYLYTRALGSTFDYFNFNAAYQSYKSLKTNHVIATQVLINMNWGNVPFLDLAKAGGTDMLRGYAQNRFRDQHFVGAQVEYRFQVWRRFGMVLFSGIGDVFNQPSDLQLERLKYSFGPGLRYMLSKNERLNLRFDWGFGNNNNSFYISMTEAF